MAETASKGAKPAAVFPTHTEGIRELEEWLLMQQVPEVGLESTGVYWKPVWNALEGKLGLPSVQSAPHPGNPGFEVGPAGAGRGSWRCWRSGNFA